MRFTCLHVHNICAKLFVSSTNIALVCLFVCLFDLILYVPSTIFQLYRDGSTWVEPVLSLVKCVLLKDHNAVTPVRLEPAALQPLIKHSTTEPLRSLYRSRKVFAKIMQYIYNNICTYLQMVNNHWYQQTYTFNSQVHNFQKLKNIYHLKQLTF